MDGGVQVEALGDLLIVTEPETDFVAIYHPPLVRSILVFCLRAALAALPPPIWLSCSSLTCSSSACVFSSLASFWPRSASRPVRRILPDNFCLIFVGQTPGAPNPPALHDGSSASSLRHMPSHEFANSSTAENQDPKLIRLMHGFLHPLHDLASVQTGREWPLCGGLAAIDDDGLPCEKRRLTRQKQDGVSDLLGRRRPLDWHGIEEVRLPHAASSEAIEHLCLHRARRHGIDAHAARRPFQRRSLG